jgi:riboflavin biosynthesis pyrimidine reductase
MSQVAPPELLPELGPDSPASAQASGYPWPDGPWLRANMVVSLDGAFRGPDGLSKSLSGPADQRVLRALRGWSDAVLVGANTIRAEGYRPLRVRPELALARRAAGLRPAPRLVVVSAGLDMDFGAPLFRESALPPLVIAPQGAPADFVALARRACPVLLLPPVGEDLMLSPSAILSAIRARGMTHILCEGGPSLLSELVTAGLLDEFDLTTSPVLVGIRPPDPALPPAAAPSLDLVAHLHSMRLAAIRTESGFVFARYIRESGEC